MGRIQILAYNENEFIVSKEATDEMLNKPETRVDIGINPLLKYKDETDVIGCQLRVSYSVSGQQVMGYSSILSVFVEGWQEFMKASPSIEAIRSFVSPAWFEVLGFVRGAICVRALSQGYDAVARRLLPPIEMERFMTAVAVEKVQ